MMNMTETVKHLIIINIIFFVGSLLVPAAGDFLALFYFENANFKVWQPLTHMFIHGGIMHIFFNMFALFSFGSALEHFWGGKKFLFLYISCGLGAAALHTAVNYYEFHQGLSVLAENGFKQDAISATLAEGKFDTRWQEVMSASNFTSFMQSYLTPAVGASGAIYGLLVAFAFMFPNAELALMFIPVPVKAKYFCTWVVSSRLVFRTYRKIHFWWPKRNSSFRAYWWCHRWFYRSMWYWKKNQFNENRWD